MKAFDVSISGTMGLYTIDPRTAKARTWCKSKLEAECIEHFDAIVCEGGERCRAIVAGMVAFGLRVEVNGVDMKGFKAA